MRMMALVAMALALALAGCGLYSGDDDDPGVDAGSVRPMSGSYRATWTCATPPCTNPIADTVQAVITDGSPTTIRWVRNGDPTAIATHAGERNASGQCLIVDAGTDLGVTRGAYALCFAENRAGLEAGIEWSSTFSDVELLPL